MTEKKSSSSFGIYLAIFCYYFLPKIQVTTISSIWDTIFNVHSFIVSIIPLAMLIITFQKTYTTKWKNVNLTSMVVIAYLLFFLSTIIAYMLTEFIR